MSRPLVDHVCAECHARYQSRRKQQVCCSLSCAAYRRHRLSPNPQRDIAAKARAAWIAKCHKIVGQRIRHCATRGDVWRLAYKLGYAAGYARATQTKRARRMAA